jgi:hypothetical protein
MMFEPFRDEAPTPKVIGISVKISVAESHNFYAAPDPASGKSFDAAPAAPAPAPTLLYSKAKFLKMN